MKNQSQKGKITALYERLSHDDGRSDESVSIENQELLCKGWSHHLIHMTAVHLWQMVHCSCEKGGESAQNGRFLQLRLTFRYK